MNAIVTSGCVDLSNENTFCGRDAHRLMCGPFTYGGKGMRERLLALVPEAQNDRATNRLHL